MTFYEPAGWCSSNAGVKTLKDLGKECDYVVTEDVNGHNGSAARITSIDTKGQNMIIAKIPKVTTGTLYPGAFKVTILSKTLLSTKFGNPWMGEEKRPVTVKGFYKYQSGATYYSSTKENPHKFTEEKGKKDACMLAAVLYETDEIKDDWSDCLTGEDIYTSDRIAAIAQYTSEGQESWAEFTLNLEYKKDYDPSKKYRFAMIFSSSKDGDTFSGAPGSTLWIDDVTLINE